MRDLTDAELLDELRDLLTALHERLQDYIEAADEDAAVAGFALAKTAHDTWYGAYGTSGRFDNKIYDRERLLEDLVAKTKLATTTTDRPVRGWSAFLAGHPELTARRDVDEQEVAAALADAVRAVSGGAVTASAVARRLFDDEHVSLSEAIRVGHALGRLNRANPGTVERIGDAPPYRWRLVGGDDA